MAYALPDTKKWAGVYDVSWVREYVVRRTALLGIFSWNEVVHTERLGSETRLEVGTTKPVDRVLINGVEYLPV